MYNYDRTTMRKGEKIAGKASAAKHIRQGGRVVLFTVKDGAWTGATLVSGLVLEHENEIEPAMRGRKKCAFYKLEKAETILG